MLAQDPAHGFHAVSMDRIRNPGASGPGDGFYSTVTGILPIFACQCLGAV
jgi:hypothetical protein